MAFARFPDQPEEAFQNQTAAYVDVALKPDVLSWHTPNGGKRDAVAGAKLKRAGARPGVPDWLFFYAGQLYAIELKTRTGSLSTEQKDWRDGLIREGAEWALVRTLDDFIAQLAAWALTKGT